MFVRDAAEHEADLALLLATDRGVVRTLEVAAEQKAHRLGPNHVGAKFRHLIGTSSQNVTSLGAKSRESGQWSPVEPTFGRHGRRRGRARG
jgi:hypothetical protein